MAAQVKAAKSTQSADVAPIRFDDSSMQSSYANVCHVASSREELSLLFGTNQNWQAGNRGPRIKLDHRIVLTPFAAKRLLALLGHVIREYESRFGEIALEATSKAESGA